MKICHIGEYDKDVEILFWGTGQTEEVKLQDGLVGKFIGGDESSTVDPSQSGDDESPEPLALLAIHAAMHMLFLPQFTCDFYEDEELDDGSTYSEDSYKNNTSSNHGNGEIKAEIALKRTRYVQDGIQLKPKPACILWAPGCGVKKLKVSNTYSHYNYLHVHYFLIPTYLTNDSNRRIIASLIRTALKFFVCY